MGAEEIYDRRIFQNLESFSKVQFVLLKLGPLCNATKSRLFTEAECDTERVKDGDIPIAVNFSLIFQPGLSLLKDIRDDKKQTFPNHEKSAIRKLDEYVKVLGQHEKCLKKVLKRQQPSEKETVTVAVGEHLLGKLAPGGSHIINENVKEMMSCQCGCNERPVYSYTGIGHQDVWHGYTDIVFQSHAGIPECIATTQVSSLSSSCAILHQNSPAKRPKFEDDDDNDDDDEEEIISEANILPAERTEDQAIAQIIVFSLHQRQKHPNHQHHLVPNIVISPTDFQIFMYDAVNDILLGSYPLQLFDVETESLRIESIMILWMVLHYQMFCEGIKVDALTDDFKNLDMKSHFRKIAGRKWDVYSTALNENISYFSPAKKRSSITFDSNWFAKELAYKNTSN